MNRREFLCKTGPMAAGLATLSLGKKVWGQEAVSAPAAAGAAHPNVLFIAIEDNAPQRWHTWGNPICQTPNMDRLAATGVKFDLANCMAPPCNPSRTSLLLGLRPETTTVYGNLTDWHPKFPTRTTMIQHFKNSGYFTFRTGKIYHEAFDNKADWSQIADGGERVGSGKKRKPLMGPGAQYGGAPGNAGPEADDMAPSKNGVQPSGVPFLYGPSGLDDLEEPDGANTTAVIAQLGKTFEQPAFLAIGYHKPHLPFSCPDKYFAMYPVDKMPLPELSPEEKARTARSAGGNTDDADMTDQMKREAIAAEFACITFVDTQIGRVLEALEKRSDADQWVVVVWADHGFLMGEHRCWRKGALYDCGVMVPFFMKVPGVTKADTVCKRPVEMVDVMPTLFDVCGLPMPDQPMEAVSMRTLLVNPEAPWKYGARTLSGNVGTRSLRTEKYRYTEYGTPEKAELFDIEKDPKELVNLAKDPQSAEAVKELHAKLQADWKELLPAGFRVPPQDLLPIKAVDVPDDSKERRARILTQKAGKRAEMTGAASAPTTKEAALAPTARRNRNARTAASTKSTE